MQLKHRIYDLVNLKAWEVKVTIFITAIVLCVLSYFDFYSEFYKFEGAITEVALVLVGAMFGTLGFSLSGVAIIVSLFNKKEIKIIDKINGEGKIEYLLSSYVFLAINVATQIVLLLIVYLAMMSDKNILESKGFWLITSVEVYHIIFIIFYTVALIENCIKMYNIKNIYEEIEDKEKNFYNIVNEVKIDFIFSTMINNFGCNLEDVKKSLIEFVDESNLKNKDEIMKYIKKQYEN